MILAAGLGTRLKPFTDSHPKALFKVNGKTLLEHAIIHLKSGGIREVIINVHHFSQQILNFLKRHDNFGMQITISDETGELLETGGGLKKAAWFFKGCDFVVIRNVDIISDLDLTKMAGYHLKHKPLATLAVRKREKGERLTSRESVSVSPYAFSGIQMISHDIFPLITEEGKFSLTDMYLRLAASQKILGFLEEGTLWKDVGRGM